MIRIMKLLTKSLFAAIIMIAFALNANAQSNSATALASATIIAPIEISVDTPMEFGYVVGTAAGGTVVLDPDGTITPTGVSLAAGIATSPAIFDVTGEAGFSYSITLPTVDPITLDDGSGNTMTVGTFTSTPVGTGTIDGTQIRVGATLTVGASQTPGTYTNNADLTVTVNYN